MGSQPTSTTEPNVSTSTLTSIPSTLEPTEMSTSIPDMTSSVSPTQELTTLQESSTTGEPVRETSELETTSERTTTATIDLVDEDSSGSPLMFSVLISALLM